MDRRTKARQGRRQNSKNRAFLTIYIVKIQGFQTKKADYWIVMVNNTLETSACFEDKKAVSSRQI